MKKMNKMTRNNLITYVMVIVLYLIVQALIMSGSLSSLMQGLLVPLCAYVILAVSLNLTVGILGELSLGHAGFMCVGAFFSAFFSYTPAAQWTVFAYGFGTAVLFCYRIGSSVQPI